MLRKRQPSQDHPFPTLSYFKTGFIIAAGVRMRTLSNWIKSPPQIPLATVWLLNDLAEYRGKQDLFTRQSPQKLRKLREHALIESAVASNRIEGVEIDNNRVGTVVFGKKHLHDRNEEEVRGYQSALSWIHEKHDAIPFSSETFLRLHALSHPGVWDSGAFKTADGEIIEKHPDGRTTIRFRPVSAAATPAAIHQLCEDSAVVLRDKQVPPLVLWAAQNLDFLCIHPFRDGNGRVSRLLLLLSLYQLGFSAGRYISLERIIEQNKERYYETLQASSKGWHESRHDPWPYVNYLLYLLKSLYEEFEGRFENTALPMGEKTETVRQAVSSFTEPFHITELQKRCPEVSLDMIRKVLKEMRLSKEVECMGRGKHARWQKMK
jgi:Fic family protein